MTDSGYATVLEVSTFHLQKARHWVPHFASMVDTSGLTPTFRTHSWVKFE